MEMDYGNACCHCSMKITEMLSLVFHHKHDFNLIVVQYKHVVNCKGFDVTDTYLERVKWITVFSKKSELCNHIFSYFVYYHSLFFTIACKLNLLYSMRI